MALRIVGIYSLLFVFITGCSSLQEKDNDSKPPPNIVLIVVDDLGYSELHCYGKGISETPHIDQLAGDGIQFMNAYASCPVCSPTRASILTGKNPVAVDITDWIPGHQHKGIKPWHKFIVPDFNQQLPLEEITIAEKLQNVGYTAASIGKWHLGGQGFLPTDQGFDINIAGNHKGMPPTYYYPYKVDDTIKKPWLNFTITPLELTGDSLYLTDRLTNEAVSFIQQKKDSLFFLYLPYYTVHTPVEGRQDLVKKYRDKLANHQDSVKRNPHFLAMVECLDENVGRIIKTLEEEGIGENTLVILVSDNGGLFVRGKKEKNEYDHIRASWNKPLRAGKGTLYEGGLRVPTIMKWPGKIEPGRVSQELIISTDIFPTIMDIVNQKIEHPIEGVSLWPHLTNKEEINRETFYWHYPHYHKTKPGAVIRDGDFKLIRYYEDERIELYDLRKDISESTNLADEMPQKAEELLKKLNAWLDKEGASMPTPNPEYVD